MPRRVQCDGWLWVVFRYDDLDGTDLLGAFDDRGAAEAFVQREQAGYWVHVIERVPMNPRRVDEDVA